MHETAVQTAGSPRPQPPPAPTPPRRTSETIAIQTSTQGDDTATAIRQLAREMEAWRERQEEAIRRLQEERARDEEERKRREAAVNSREEPSGPSDERRGRIRMTIEYPPVQEREERKQPAREGSLDPLVTRLKNLMLYGPIEGPRLLKGVKPHSAKVRAPSAPPSAAQHTRGKKPPLPPKQHPAARLTATQRRTTTVMGGFRPHERARSSVASSSDENSSPSVTTQQNGCSMCGDDDGHRRKGREGRAAESGLRRDTPTVPEPRTDTRPGMTEHEMGRVIADLNARMDRLFESIGQIPPPIQLPQPPTGTHEAKAPAPHPTPVADKPDHTRLFGWPRRPTPPPARPEVPQPQRQQQDLTPAKGRTCGHLP
uniref:Uncharacterized protein n=1 Tax=Vitrella brassicaformis TaxID=1169539 RepID=A0A7S1JLQ6_9ALVE